MGSRKYILNNYPLQLQLNFIDLYKFDIINRLNQNANLWNAFSAIVGDEVIEEYSSKHIDAENPKEKHNISEALYDTMVKSQQNYLLYTQLMDYIEMVDQELYGSLCIDNWKNETFSSTFQKFLHVLHKIRPVFDIKNVVSNLKQYSSELGQHYQPVIERWENNKIDDEYTKSLIIRTLCIMVDGASYHLLYSIYKSSDKAKEVIEDIYPDFEIFYQKNIFEDRDGIVHFVHVGDNVADAIEDIMTNGNESKHAYNLFFGSIAPYHLRPLLYENTADAPLNLHDYQYELLEKALQGENTLICAPTGSGKTVVAAYIIREHICELRKNLKMAKIVFVVPSVPLVEQQKNQFKKYLGHCVTIEGLHGGSENLDFRSLIQSIDIIVLTPQILVNATDPKFCKFEGIEPISLDLFTLIVLDEVHHTDKGHPYNELMKEYHRCKYGNSHLPIRLMPQVIGLTASLGSPNKPKNVDDVVNYMVNKCANFDARSYTTVTKNTAELYSKISKTKEYTIVDKNNDKLVNEYYNYLRSLIESIEKYLMNIDGVLRNPKIFEGHCDMKSVEYKTWLSVTSSTTLKKAKLSPSSKIEATNCLKYLDVLYETYQCAQLFPTEDTTQFYLKNLGDENGFGFDKFLYEEKQKLGNTPCSECDIFKELIKCVKNQFSKDPDSKIIIFTPQRYYCRLGSEIIERYTGKKGIFISGSNASSDEAGCNPAKQSEIVKKFRNGEIQILFATTVVDEGFDIAECNLVIKYNLVTDNIAHLQRKGRARQLLSESILITFDDKKREMEEKNMANITMIDEAYQRLETMSNTTKLSMFENAIIEYNQARVEEEKRDAAVKEKMSLRNADFILQCGKCDTYITQSSNLRLCGSYFVPYDPELWKLVEFHPSTPEEDKYNKERNIGILGTIHCKNVTEDGRLCDEKIGCVTNFKGIMLPSLTCKRITFVELGSNEVKTAKQWKNVFQNLFYPTDISHEELVSMKTFECQPNLDEVVEALGKASLAAYGIFPVKSVEV